MTKMEEYTTNANSMVADLLDWYECMPGEYPNLDHDMLAKLALMALLRFAASIAVDGQMKESDFYTLVKENYKDACEKSPTWGK